jgi:hypothetical protein
VESSTLNFILNLSARDIRLAAAQLGEGAERCREPDDDADDNLLDVG